ncbi:hypothetical protein Tco_0459138 [Tanacetum coccineum]
MDQRLILGGDLNGYIGATAEGYAGVHGGFRAGHCTKIDYLLVQRGDLKAHKDCRVFLREACSSQHSLLVLDILFKSVQHRREGSTLPKILWKNLNGEATEALRSRVVEGVSTQVEVLATSDADSMWNILASNIKDAAKDTLDVAIGTSKTHTDQTESWWLSEEVQSIVAVKQERFRELLSCQDGNQEERLRAQERYREAKKDAKKPSLLARRCLKSEDSVKSSQSSKTKAMHKFAATICVSSSRSHHEALGESDRDEAAKRDFGV